MATRRILSTERTILDRDDPPELDGSKTVNQSVAPSVPTSVIIQLLAFTAAMIVVPIGSYFATVHTVFKGNSTLAGALAAVMANVVLISYIALAMRQDQSEQKQKISTQHKKTS